MVFSKRANPFTIVFFGGLLLPLIYISGVFLLSKFSGVGFNDIVLYKFKPVFYQFPQLVNFIIKPLVSVSGLLLIIAYPGILFAPAFFKQLRRFTLPRLFSLGLILNIILLFGGTTVVKLWGITVTRLWLIGIIIIETLIGAVVFIKKKKTFEKYNFAIDKGTLLVSVLLFLILICLVTCFQNDILRPLPVDFAYREETIVNMDYTKIGDPQEEFGIARYLKTKILPYWLIKSLKKFGYYAYYPPLSYFFNFFSITLFGESYAAFNFLSLTFVFGIFLLVYKIIFIDEKKSNVLIQACIGLFMAGFILLLMESNKRPEVSLAYWPINSIWRTIDCIWIFFVMGFIYFLLKRDFFSSCAYSALATFTRYESVPYIYILFLLFYFLYREDKDFIKRHLRFYSLFLLFFSLCIFSIFIFQGEGAGRYLAEVVYEKVLIRLDITRHFIQHNFGFAVTEEKIFGYFSWPNTWKFIKFSLWGSYFFILFSVIPSRDKVVDLFSLFGLAYLFSLIIQSHKLLFYVYPLVPVSAIHLRRFVRLPTRKRLYSLLFYLVIWLIGHLYLL